MFVREQNIPLDGVPKVEIESTVFEREVATEMFTYGKDIFPETMELE
jgi:hypothetical protein